MSSHKPQQYLSYKSEYSLSVSSWHCLQENGQKSGGKRRWTLAKPFLHAQTICRKSVVEFTRFWVTETRQPNCRGNSCGTIVWLGDSKTISSPSNTQVTTSHLLIAERISEAHKARFKLKSTLLSFLHVVGFFVSSLDERRVKEQILIGLQIQFG